jgi:PKD repeat protein
LEHHWTFGDGQGSTDPAPVHTYNAPGTYTVALTLISDECSRTLTHTIEVLDAAGLGGARALDEVLAYTIPGFLVVQNNIGVALDVHIFDVASCRTMDTKRIPPNTPQWHLPTQGWASGYYLVTLRSQWDQWTFSVVVVN